MASRRSIELYKLILKVAYKTKCLPFYMDNESSSRSTVGYRVAWGSQTLQLLWRCSMYGHIGIRLCLVYILGLWYDLTHEAEVVERASFYYIFCMQLMILSLLICTLFYADRFCNLSYGFLYLRRAMITTHGLNPESRDGLEIVIKGLFLGASVVTVGMGASFLGFVYFEVHMHSLFKTEYFMVTVAYASVWTFLIFVDWVFVCLYAVNALIYVNAARRSLKLMWWRPGCSTQKKKELISLYRTHEVFHNLAMNETKSVTAVVISISAIIMISALFPLIANYKLLSPDFAICIAISFLTTYHITKVCIQCASEVTTCSEEFSASFLRNDLTLTTIENRSFRACRPMPVNVGSITTLSRTTFANLMSDVVVQRVLDLILLAKK